MAQGPKKDDKDHLADALSALSKGEHREEPPQGSGMEGQAHVDLGRQVPPVPQPVAKPPQAASAPPRSSGSRPPPQRPMSPGQLIPPAATPRPASSPPPSSGVMRPSSPTAKARPGTPGQALPGIPQRPPAQPVQAPGAQQPSFQVHDDSHAEDLAREADAVAHVVEDDDTVNMPAPSAEMISHRRAPPPPRRRAHLARTLGFKRTLIPVLLTLGVLLPGIAAWSFLLGEESPVAGAAWIPLALLGIGAVMLVFAAITMTQVKHQLEQSNRPA